MIVRTVYTEPDEYGEGDSWVLSINDKEKLNVSGGQPEDNTLGRDLNFVFSIPDMLKEAFDAGKAGEEFKMVKETINQ